MGKSSDHTGGDDPSRLLIGVITGPHGVRGQVRVKAFTEDPQAIGDFGAVETQEGRRFEIVITGTGKGVVLCRLVGVSSRNEAEALRGTELFVHRDQLPDIDDDDEWYASDLVGLAAFLVTGEVLGKVVAVRNFGAGDLLEVALNDEDRTVFVPFTEAVVPVVDPDNGRVEIDPLDGLLDAGGPLPDEELGT